MPARDIITIGASAGSLGSIIRIIKELPPGLPAAVFVVIHSSADSPGLLHEILGRSASIPVVLSRDKDEVQPGRVYVTPPDHHLLPGRPRMRVIRGPKENGFRPAVDPLFRAAARAYGPRVAGIVLSGALDDGTYGLWLIKKRGGIAIVQDPKEALVPSMPLSALRSVQVDHVLPVAEIAPTIVKISAGADWQGFVSDKRAELDGAEMAFGEEMKNQIVNKPPSGFTCPDCGGALWESENGKNGELLTYRCHVGHGYTAQGLLSSQSQTLEQGLWSAFRGLRELAAFRSRLADRARKGNMTAIADMHQQQADDAEKHARLIQTLLESDHIKIPDITSGEANPSTGQSSAVDHG